MTNEEISQKTCNLAIRVASLAWREIHSGYRQFKSDRRNKKLHQQAKQPKGKQSVKELIGQGQGVSTIDIADTGLKDFQKLAKKYGVDFAVVKDKAGDPPKYTIFFKAKDADAIDHLMSAYAAKQLKREQEPKRPSILKKLAHFKDIVAKTPRKEHEKKKEQTR